MKKCILLFLFFCLSIQGFCFPFKRHRVDFTNTESGTLSAKGPFSLQWESDKDAVKYQLEGSLSDNFSDTVYLRELHTPQAVVDLSNTDFTGELNENKSVTCFFRVRILLENGKTGRWSSVLAVHYTVLPKVRLICRKYNAPPEKLRLGEPLSVGFSLDQKFDGHGFIQVSLDHRFSDIYWEAECSQNSFQKLPSIPEKSFWVRAGFKIRGEEDYYYSEKFRIEYYSPVLWHTYKGFYSIDRQFILRALEPETGDEIFQVSIPDFWEIGSLVTEDGRCLVLGKIQKEDNSWESQLYIFTPEGKLEKKLVLNFFHRNDYPVMINIPGKGLFLAGANINKEHEDQVVIYRLDLLSGKETFAAVLDSDISDEKFFYIRGIEHINGEFFLYGRSIRYSESAPFSKNWIASCRVSGESLLKRTPVIKAPHFTLLDILVKRGSLLYLLASESVGDDPYTRRTTPFVIEYDLTNGKTRQKEVDTFDSAGRTFSGAAVFNGGKLITGWGQRIGVVKAEFKQMSFWLREDLRLEIPKECLERLGEGYIPLHINHVEVLSGDLYLISGNSSDIEGPFVNWICLVNSSGKMFWQKSSLVYPEPPGKWEKFSLWVHRK